MNFRHARYFVLATAGIIALVSSTIATAAQDVVELRLRGRYYSEPATIRITVAVEPDAENRMLVIQADGERLYRSSQVALQGESEQRIHMVEFKNLPAGHYVIRAEVMSKAQVRGTAEKLLIVGAPSDDER